MRKLGVILVVAAVVIGCVLAAGCTNNSSTSSTPSTDNPALTIDVAKTGSAVYNIGDTFTITLPSNASTGFSWKDYSTEAGSGLTVSEESVKSTSTALGAAGAQSFTYTAKEEGLNPIVLTYQKGSEDPIYVYGDLMVVQKSDNDHTTSEFIYTGDYTPQAGKVVLITANGNPTTGYELVADEESAKEQGLTILKTDYVPNTTSGLVGAGGTYKWYVTASQPNMYMFTVNEVHAGDSESTVKFYVPITFTVEA